MKFPNIKKWFTNSNTKNPTSNTSTNSTRDWVNGIPFNFKVNYSFWKFNEPFLLDYIENVAMELAKNENIPIFFSSFEAMNKNEKIENEKAVGIFKYIGNNERRTQYEKNVVKLRQINYTLPKDDIYPRIEISELGDVFTILHELGHYFIYKRCQEQSELGANQFIEEFFDTYLPPFFKWIYQIEIKIRSKNDFSFTNEEIEKNYNDYLKFKSNYEQEKLQRYATF